MAIDVWLDVQSGYLLAGSGEEAMAFGLGTTFAGIAAPPSRYWLQRRPASAHDALPGIAPTPRAPREPRDEYAIGTTV